jgi:hypothetical protein
VNPVKTVSKFKENNERVTYLTSEEEKAVLAALPPEYRPHFLVSIPSQTHLFRPAETDMEGHRPSHPVHHCPQKQAWAVKAGSHQLNGPLSPVGPWQRPAASGRPDRAGLCAEAQGGQGLLPGSSPEGAKALKEADVEAPHLDEYSWHGNRHTFASRLAMTGAELLTIKEVGGWRTLAMVQRYAHLAPGHLQAAVERLVSPQEDAVELARN